jgi:hypothetical protein
MLKAREESGPHSLAAARPLAHRFDTVSPTIGDSSERREGDAMSRWLWHAPAPVESSCAGDRLDVRRNPPHVRSSAGGTAERRLVDEAALGRNLFALVRSWALRAGDAIAERSRSKEARRHRHDRPGPELAFHVLRASVPESLVPACIRVVPAEVRTRSGAGPSGGSRCGYPSKRCASRDCSASGPPIPPGRAQPPSR